MSEQHPPPPSWPNLIVNQAEWNGLEEAGYDMRQFKLSKPIPAKDEPFGRQLQPVTVILVGEDRDVDTYMSKLRRIIDNGSYDMTVKRNNMVFTIYPRAVND